MPFPYQSDQLYNEVLSWPVSEILNREQLHDKVMPIPDRFQRREDYTNSFRVPFLVEVWHHIYLSMDTMSNVIFVQETEKIPCKKGCHDIKLNLPAGKNPPKPLDLLLMSAYTVNSKQQILNEKMPCTILWVDSVSQKRNRGGTRENEKTVVVKVRLSIKPFAISYDKTLDKTSRPLQVVLLTNMITFSRAWEMIRLGFPVRSRMNIIFDKKNYDDRECNQCRNVPVDISECDRFELNNSQRDAVTSCVLATRCSHIPSVRLIWGPPGTGKTRTVAVMLLAFLRMNKQTLVCAPTNVAIMQVASHLVELIEKYENPEMPFSFGDIVLFGNQDRMKVGKSLSKIYISNRVEDLSKCYNTKVGFNQHLWSVLQYLITCSSQNKYVPREQQKDTCREYSTHEFSISLQNLASCTCTLLTHLPKSSLYNKIMSVKVSVEKLQLLLCADGLNFDKSLDRITESFEELVKLKFPDTEYLQDKCLNQARLILCTASMSSRLPKKQYDILVIDEAANLKECESMIPLSLEGFNNLFLVGDEKQLESVVKSKIAKEAGLGRSLYERLVQIGYVKLLLNVQYRMHPSISLFPNKTFYDGRIIDGPNVKDNHNSYLDGDIYGTYSFIHIEDGKEHQIDQSTENRVEAAVAANILCRLAKACSKQKKRTSVGVICPYVAQVTALKEISRSYHNHEFLSVQVQTIDSFQGGEKDITIFSTVRCNNGGIVGFLDCERRINVALTRAKNCLWILGHKTTLLNSKSTIWHMLLKDAEDRRIFFDARDDKDLAEIIKDVARRQGQGSASYKITDQVKLMGQTTRGAVPNPEKPSPVNSAEKAMNAEESNLKAAEDKSAKAAPALSKQAEAEMRAELGEKKKEMRDELGEKKKQETSEEVNKPAEKSKAVADQGGELNGQGRPSASMDAPEQGNGLKKVNFVRRNKRKRGELTAQDVARRQGQRLASYEITDQVKLVGKRTRGAVPNPEKPSLGNGLRKVKTQCHPDRIFDMVNKFNEDKQLLVRNMGCQSMLDMNRRTLDSGLSRDLLWLVDTTAGTLRIGDRHIPIRKYVRSITGLPNGPTEIKADDSVSHFDDDELFDELPPSTLGLPLSVCMETDDRKFSIKFILAIIALYVAPSTSPTSKDYKKYFGPISKCEDIKSLNLCELAVKSLLDGIAKYKLEDCDTCGGCLDILHVMFIDFVSTESIHLQRGSPRIKFLTHHHFDLLHSMESVVLNVEQYLGDTTNGEADTYHDQHMVPPQVPDDF